MNPKAALYAFVERSNTRVIQATFRKYIPRIAWSGAVEHVADAGCGSGRTTKQLLLPHLPPNVTKITAFDRSQDMIRTARECHVDPRIDYMVADIDDRKTFRPEWRGKFSKVVSHYCLHWLRDVHEGLGNIASILQTRGQLFAVVLTRAPLFEVPKEFKRCHPKWSNYCRAPLPGLFERDADQQKDFFQDALREAGFELDVFDTRKSSMDFEVSSVHQFKDVIRSLGLFYTDIPEELKDEYVSDYAQRMWEMTGKYDISGDKHFIIATKVA